MEHYPNRQPMDRKRWVGFDAFDHIMDEALQELDPPKEPAEVIDLNANVIELHTDVSDVST